MIEASEDWARELYENLSKKQNQERQEREAFQKANKERREKRLLNKRGIKCH